jgi:transposase
LNVSDKEIRGDKMKQKHSWEITDAFWEAAEPLIPKRERNPEREYKRKPGGGRPPMEGRKVLEAIFFVLRTGIQWKALPKSFGASSAVHQYFMFWCRHGFFKELWKAGLNRYDEVQGIDWTWLSGDGCMTKAPLALETVGPNPTDRGKKREQTPFTRRRKRGTACLSSNGGKSS